MHYIYNMQHISHEAQVLSPIPPPHPLAVYKEDNKYEKGQNRKDKVAV